MVLEWKEARSKRVQDTNLNPMRHDEELAVVEPDQNDSAHCDRRRSGRDRRPHLPLSQFSKSVERGAARWTRDRQSKAKMSGL